MQTTTTHTHPAPVDFPADLSPALDALAWGRDPVSCWIDGFEDWTATLDGRLVPSDYNPAEVARLVLRLDCLDMDMGAFAESLGRWPGCAE